MLRIPIMGLLVASLVAWSFSGVFSGDRSAEAETVVVDVGVQGPPFLWVPSNATVSVGTTVRWIMTGTAPHTVTSEGCYDARIGPCTFDSGAAPADFLRAGSARSSFQVTFDKPGVYPFVCRLHGSPGGQGMFGVIVVYEPGQSMPSGNYKASASLLATIAAEKAAAAAIRPPSTGDAGILGTSSSSAAEIKVALLVLLTSTVVGAKSLVSKARSVR